MRALALTLAGFTLALLARSSPVPEHQWNTTSGTVPSKRWTSIKTSEQVKAEGVTRVDHGVWPAMQGSGTPIRYCFADEKIAKAIFPVLAPAIAMWAPAERYSSIKFMPDLSCHNKQKDGGQTWTWECLCSLETAADALFITDGTRSLDTHSSHIEKWSGKIQTYVGYDYTRHEPGRHYLSFPAIHEKPFKDREQILRNIMAHELGHVLGLSHEHQRPDRLRYLQYRPDYMAGYEDMLKKIRDPNDANKFPETVTEEREKIRLGTNGHEYAKDFFEMAIPYVDERTIADTHIAPAEGFVHDADIFDYGSIMMYDSMTSMPDFPNDEAKLSAYDKGHCPIMRKLPDGKLEHVFSGGHDLDSRISVIDVQRIATLYPSPDVEIRAQVEALSQLETMSVLVPGQEEPWELKPSTVQTVGPNLKPIYGNGISEASNLAEAHTLETETGQGQHEGQVHVPAQEQSQDRMQDHDQAGGAASAAEVAVPQAVASGDAEGTTQSSRSSFLKKAKGKLRSMKPSRWSLKKSAGGTSVRSQGVNQRRDAYASTSASKPNHGH